MSEVVHILWQSALAIVALCVILYFMPIAMTLLRNLVIWIFGKESK